MASDDPSGADPGTGTGTRASLFTALTTFAVASVTLSRGLFGGAASAVDVAVTTSARRANAAAGRFMPDGRDGQSFDARRICR